MLSEISKNMIQYFPACIGQVADEVLSAAKNLSIGEYFLMPNITVKDSTGFYQIAGRSTHLNALTASMFELDIPDSLATGINSTNHSSLYEKLIVEESSIKNALFAKFKELFDSLPVDRLRTVLSHKESKAGMVHECWREGNKFCEGLELNGLKDKVVKCFDLNNQPLEKLPLLSEVCSYTKTVLKTTTTRIFRPTLLAHCILFGAFSVTAALAVNRLHKEGRLNKMAGVVLSAISVAALAGSILGAAGLLSYTDIQYDPA